MENGGSIDATRLLAPDYYHITAFHQTDKSTNAMAETQPNGIDDLLQTLEELTSLVKEGDAQPIHQLAENAVLFWLRVVEEKDLLLPRLNEARFLPASFPFGMERSYRERMDSHPPAKELEGYSGEFGARLSRLAEVVEAYFTREGYRGSSEQCDQAMMEVCHLSRFLGSCALDAELLAEATPGLAPDGVLAPEAGTEARDAQALLNRVRNDFLTWEPLLNEAVVSWGQNSLNEFDSALAELRRMFALDEAGRREFQVPPGYPLRQRGRMRLKVSSFNPALRPLRTKSMFTVRQGQLQKRIEEMESGAAAFAGELREDMLHFITMVRRNHFMLASEPSFWNTHRPGLPLVRGWPTQHPFLMEPIEFFKKAVLFHNRTYTVAGGGVDAVFLQVNQLERYYKFHAPTGTRAIRQIIALGLRRWEENSWEAFTGQLLHLAKTLRAAGAPPENQTPPGH